MAGAAVWSGDCLLRNSIIDHDCTNSLKIALHGVTNDFNVGEKCHIVRSLNSNVGHVASRIQLTFIFLEIKAIAYTLHLHSLDFIHHRTSSILVELRKHISFMDAAET